MIRRTSMRLAPHEAAVFCHLYTDRGIPSDQYKRRPREAERFLCDWNELTDRDDCWEDVYHYMINARKNGKLPALGAGHKRLAAVPPETLNEAEWRELIQAYTTVVKSKEIGADSLLFDADTSVALAREFYRRTGRRLPSPTLTALVVDCRKRGDEWTRLCTPARQRDGAELNSGWGDIDEVA